MTFQKLEEHKAACVKQNEQQIIMPMKANNDTIEFRSFYKKMCLDFVVYADIESILKKSDDEISNSDKTSAYQKHEAFSIGYYCDKHDTSKYRSKTGPDCVKWFVGEMENIAHAAKELLERSEPMQLSLEDEVLFIWAEECHICGKEFIDVRDKVRDHCHTTGVFRGAAHNACNLNYQRVRYVTVIFHNLSHYDAHFIIQAFAQNMEGSTSVIPCNDEVYISFSKFVDSTKDEKGKGGIKLRFIGSLRFMASSLDTLSSLLPFDEKHVLRSEFNDLNADELKLLERKGVFCYDYVDSIEKLNETSLPPIEEFYSSLNLGHITKKNYEHAQSVWNTFNIKTLGEYAELYMKVDILLLADVFQNFRRTCYSKFELDPAHYFTAPGLSFEAMLKQTQVEIELLTDIDMLLFVERGIRGGISQCSKRYARANNKYTENFDSNIDPNFLVYLDANNLYGWSMMQYLPLNDFQWCERTDFTPEEIMNMPDDSDIGYIFEVDLSYPEHLHDLHKDYPFCAEKMNVPNTKNDQKLLLTLFDKKEYVIHYRMLKCALKNGLVLDKIHRVLQFHQAPWLKPYIDFNTRLRTEATNEFEKNFYKLLINAIFGKTMENVRSRAEIKLRTKWDGRYGLRSYVAKPNFKKYKIFDEEFAAVEMNKTHVVMEKPITVGMSILDISKVLMYDFYYGHLKKKYGDNIEMLYTDTDSFVIDVKTDCFYTDMINDIEKYDTSDYAESNEYGMPRVNKKIPGLFKDELNGQIFTEFVGLRSKMYTAKIRKQENDEKEKNKEEEKEEDKMETEEVKRENKQNDLLKKAKGIRKCILKKTVSFKDYMDCIEQNCCVVRKQNSIRSRKHQVYTITQTKVALSPYDNKRYILDGNIDTLPWGHYQIPNYQSNENV